MEALIYLLLAEKQQIKMARRVLYIVQKGQTKHKQTNRGILVKQNTERRKGNCDKNQYSALPRGLS